MPRMSCWAIAALALLAGCARTPPPIVEAQGVVLLDGVPLKKAEVRFFPADDFGPEYIAKGITDEAGRFTLTCKGEPGACAGENQVIVVESPIPNRLRSDRAQAELAKYLQSLGGRPLPQRYANLVESPLKVDVQEGRKEHVLNLTRE